MNMNREFRCPGGEAEGRKDASCLAMLNLRPEDFDELRRQGFVSREAREGRSYFKLRFRRHGRQVAIGLGKAPWLAERIGRELDELQANRRLEREQKRLIEVARSLLRCAKRELEPALRDVGYVFYGYEIRRLRGEKQSRNQR
jgi:hypothetical protein